MVQFSICMPYPGTVMYNEVLPTGRIVAKTWREYDMTYGPILEVEGMPREELKLILPRAYREFHFRPAYFWRTLRNIRTLDEFKRVMRSVMSLLSVILLHRRKA